MKILVSGASGLVGTKLTAALTAAGYQVGRLVRDRSRAAGSDVVWNPAYTAIMVTNGLFPAWTLDDIALWQYCGDGDAVFAKLPKFIKGFGDGKVDISVHIDGARKPTLQSLHKALVLK